MMNTELNEVRIWRVFAMLRTAQEDLRRIGVNHNIDLQSVIDRLELASYSLIAGQNAQAGNAGRCADKHAELGACPSNPKLARLVEGNSGMRLLSKPRWNN